MIDLDRLRDEVCAFRQVQPVYRCFARILARVLEQGANDLGIEAVIQCRTKEIASFAEKTVRKMKQYPDAVRTMTDLCGARVIVNCRERIRPVCDMIRRCFEVCEFEDAAARLGEEEFQYRSIHFIVALKDPEAADAAAQIEAALPAGERASFRRARSRLYERRRRPVKTARAVLPPGPCFKAEIQVRTLLEHAWASVAHDPFYKPGFRPPSAARRNMSRVAAALEEADEDVCRVLDMLRLYETHFGSYLDAQERRAERERLDAIRAYDPGNPELARAAARLRMVDGEWREAATLLRSLVKAWERAPWSDARGRRTTRGRVLDLALRSSRGAAEAERLRDAQTPALLLDYGWALHRAGVDPAAARTNVERARALDPERVDPHVALAEIRYADGDLQAASAGFAAAMKISPSEPHALEGFLRCRILGDRGLRLAASLGHVIEHACAVCRERIAANVDLPRAYYDLAFFALLQGDSFGCADAYLRALLRTDTEETIDAELCRTACLAEAAPEVADWRWIRKLLTLGKARLRLERDAVPGEVCALLKPERVAASPVCKPGCEPLVMIAGGGMAAAGDSARGYAGVVRRAFRGFGGTVYRNRFRSGAGRLAAGAPQLVAVQTWIDLLSGGIDPGTVRVLAIGGGKEAAFECRLALLLGAQVGAVTGSGHAADELPRDREWCERRDPWRSREEGDDPRVLLLALPCDPDVLRVFVCGPRAGAAGPCAADLERLARRQHAGNARERIEKLQKQLRVERNAPWSRLKELYRDSVRDRVAHLAFQLASVGLRAVRRPAGAPSAPGLRAFSRQQLQAMARIEHGRWTVERLSRGWTAGPERNEAARTHDCLVPWAELSEEERDKDRLYVRQILRLRELGYAIVPAGQPRAKPRPGRGGRRGGA